MNLYFEMYSGISGDMTIAALLDLGASKEKLESALNSMKIGEYSLIFSRTQKKGLDAYKFDVILKEENEHHHEEHHHGHHSHRNLAEINKIIDSGTFSDKVKNNAKKIFNIIADAEAKAHGISKEKVHFHEIGAIDSIVDIVGICVLLEDLAPEHIYFSELYEGKGFVECAHGMMPVPVPAVANIIQAHNLTLNQLSDMGEHITPTGVAVVACFNEGLPPESFKIKNIGIGAGKREFKNTANILRVMNIEESKKKQ